MTDDAPSVGWQGVYAAMAVSTNHERRRPEATTESDSHNSAGHR